MSDSRQEHWRDVAEDDQYISKIYDLGWDVYTQYKEYLI